MVKLIISIAGGALVYSLNAFVLSEKYCFPGVVFAVMCAFYAPYYFDRSEYSHGSRYWKAAAKILQPKLLSFYRSLGLAPRVIISNPDTFNDCKQAIFASHPHGVMSFHHALMYLNVDGAEKLIEAIPLEFRRALGARSLFGVPVLRDVLLMAGAVDASAPVASKCLNKGLSLTVLPGGEQEQLLAERDQHLVFVKSRKGFCKLSIKHNVPVVPMYCFGETSTFQTSSFLFAQRKWLAKKFFVAIPFPWGSGLLNPFAPLPAPLSLCVGDPIEIPLPDSSLDSEADLRRRVDLLHTKYVDAIVKLFEQNKVACGHPNAQLVVM